jgi:phosphate transport system permease protein
MAVADLSVRSKMATAAKRIARLKRVDRAAVFVITLGGLSVVLAVLGILVFIGAEALPMFRGAGVTTRPPVTLANAPSDLPPGIRAAGLDEYGRNLFSIEPDGTLVFRTLTDGAVMQVDRIAGLEAGPPVVSSSRSVLGNYLAAGTADGRVALMQVQYVPTYDQQTLSGLTITVRDRGLVELDPGKRPIQQVDYHEENDERIVAAVVGDRELLLWRASDTGEPVRGVVSVPEGERVLHARVGRRGAIAAATDRGRLYHWLFEDEARLTDTITVGDEAITALEYLIGGTSLVVGTQSGQVTSWFRAAVEGGNEVMVRGHVYEPQGAAVVAFAASPRDRTFAAMGADGSLVLRHQTSERTLARLRLDGPAGRLVMSPKADAVLAVAPGRVQSFDVSNPHPEISWRALFGKTWYESYPEPEYVWQSSSGSDDFEPKFSLVPLIFGTIKGTLYALLFAVPIAVLAALYTSQFVHPSIRAKVKPTVEIMAALPSVVIGFLAGLYLASVVERHLVAVFLMMGLLPLFGTSGFLLWRLLPRPLSQRLKPGTEVFLILPLLLLGAWTAVATGPLFEAAFFSGDAKSWLSTSLGLTYDQRNCLVVGLAMGFAVIPIIFTIAEDAFTSVPSNLTAASLALGASRWQTAVRVVLPTASPGVFSAVMIGFGRAIGETMIVLMATGNTPVMEWSIFNGIRTLSANIAVEIPEAPHGGTLYRTLFLAAALLFVMTFIINTIAEVIRQRLRERYKAV